MATNTTQDTLQWLVSTISGPAITAYLNVAPQGARYPLVTITPISTTSQYTLDYTRTGVGERIDSAHIQCAIYDTALSMTNIMAAVTALDPVDKVTLQPQGSSTIIGAERINSIGPTWQPQEHQWRYIAEYLIMASTVAINTQLQKIVTGTTAIAQGALTVDVAWAFGSVPSTIVVSVSKPDSAGFSVFATVRKDTITATGFSVDLSAQVPVSGYALDWYCTVGQ